MSCCNACATGGSCSCEQVQRPNPKLCATYGDTGFRVIGRGTQINDAATGIAAGGGTASLVLSYPANWRPVCGDKGYRGIRLSWSGVTHPALVSISRASVAVYDGAGTLLQTEVVGELQAQTLASLLCGDTGLAQSECFLYPWPRRGDTADPNAPLCVGAEQFEELMLVVTNNQAAGAIDVSSTVNLEACCA